MGFVIIVLPAPVKLANEFLKLYFIRYTLYMIHNTSSRRGFTLIELLVVMVIIGVLASLILPNYMSARERARDVQRKSDLEQIQKALELFKMDQSPPAYPSDTSVLDVDGHYMKKVPLDPKNSGEYIYTYSRERISGDKLTYSLTACLENASDPDGISDDALCPTSGNKIERTEP